MKILRFVSLLLCVHLPAKGEMVKSLTSFLCWFVENENISYFFESLFKFFARVKTNVREIIDVCSIIHSSRVVFTL